MAGRKPLCLLRIEAAVEEAARVGARTHAPLTVRSAGPPSSTKRRSQ
jgi:hypothetical protein